MEIVVECVLTFSLRASHRPCSLIGKLLIGYLDTSRTSSESESTSYLPTQVSTRKEGFAVPAPRVPKAVVAAAARQSTLGHGTANNNNSEDEDDKDPWDD